MNNERFERNSLVRILWVIFFSFLCTLLMAYLDAYEKLQQFIASNPVFGFKEFIVFFPAFIAMGFLLYSTKQIKELEFEIRQRWKTEKALLESEKRFRELSITDELTGLYNVRYFFGRLRNEIKRTDRYSKPLSLIFMDINDFKHYNDSYGHIEGDQVLREIAQTIRSSIRECDSAYRYGGDEFVIILPESREQDAEIVAVRVKENINVLEFFPNSNEAVSMTVSSGIAGYTPGEQAEEFVKRADMNMYVSKYNKKS